MEIILCSKQDAVRDRWGSILFDKGYSLHQVAFVESLKKLLQKVDNSLVIIHRSFADFKTLSDLCGMPDTCRVFIFSDKPDDADVLALLRLGAVGYTNTYISPARLVEAVKFVLSGRIWVGQRFLQLLINSTARGAASVPSESNILLENLSPREAQIAQLVAEGLVNQAIGDKLFISERTVKSHLSNIFSKTGTHSRLQLALLVHGHR